MGVGLSIGVGLRGCLGVGAGLYVCLGDDFAKDVLAHISPSPTSCSTLEGSSQHYQEFKWQDGLLFYKNLLYVPDGSPYLQVLEHCHDAPCRIRVYSGRIHTVPLYSPSLGYLCK